MSRLTQSLAADGSVTFDIMPSRRDVPAVSTVQIAGTFGSGTVTIAASLDGGTTYTTLKSPAGSSLAITAADIFNFELESDPKLPTKLRFTLAGATNPSITVSLMRRQ